MNHPKKIAIIGSGISGLAAAYMLHPHHDITLYEKNNYLGGHSRTVDVNLNNQIIPVDTGFIVFNHRNYPLLTPLFQHLGVETAKSDMSFATSIDNGWLEYGTQTANNFFAQRRNIFRPKFLKMIADILKFNKKSKQFLLDHGDLSLGECLERLNMGDWFTKYYILAMGGAIWSTPLSKMLEFPAHSFIRFFENHGLLSVNDQPQWHTVKGGSKEYVSKISASYADKIRLNDAVEKVIRQDNKVTIISQNGQAQYDEVVFACHSDQALAMIENPSEFEREIISDIEYQKNLMILHQDISFMPKNKNAWASWVYLCEGRNDENPCVSLSYWMNNLQPLATQTPIIVTLNPSRLPDENLIFDEYWFEHPVFDAKAIKAQERIEEIQGVNHLWFCGAYQRYGFHEDGLQSSVKMAAKMGIKPSWI